MTRADKVYELEWARLAGSHSDRRIREIASHLCDEPLAHRYFPYASHSDLRISRTPGYPWDDEGLPYVRSCPDDEFLYEARDGDFRPRSVGDLRTVVEAFLGLLEEVPEKLDRN